MNETHERKRLKYTDLVEKCIANGWKTWFVEIGCCGFLGNALWRAFKMLGIAGNEIRANVKEAGRVAKSRSSSGVPMDMAKEKRPHLGEGSGK